MPTTNSTSAAFREFDWSRFDVWAIVECSGIATIDRSRREPCRQWLSDHGYDIATFDCSPGLNAALPELGRILNWEEQFGYLFEDGTRNLDALRDGFQFDVPAHCGRVFEIVRPDKAFREDARWLLGLLAIALEYSRHELALGRRFFTLLVVPERSRLIGQTIETLSVPGATSRSFGD